MGEHIAATLRLRQHRVHYTTLHQELLDHSVYIRSDGETVPCDHLYVEWPRAPAEKSRRRARACDVIRYSVRSDGDCVVACEFTDRPAHDICVVDGTYNSYRLWFTALRDLRDAAHLEMYGADRPQIEKFLSLSMILSPYERSLVMSRSAARRPVLWATLTDYRSYEAAYSYDLSGIMPTCGGARWFGNEPLSYNDMRVIASVHPRTGRVRAWYFERGTIVHVTVRGRTCVRTRLRWRKLNCARIYVCNNEIIAVNGAGSITRLQPAVGPAINVVTREPARCITPRNAGDRWCMYDGTWRAGSRPRMTVVAS